ncbi:MAG: hypothetical protein GX549_02545 [Clostridiales bacterium]|nr:hypothetical protein [Clostridiales bacterium]
MKNTDVKRFSLGRYSVALPVALTMAGIVAAPQASLSSARDGLNLFMTVVLPSLLPFFICSRLLLGTPLIEDAGRLLEPVMRPLFGCPGCTAFALLISLLSGYPAGARTVALLYEQGRLRDDELKRAASLCSTSGPLFMLGAVGSGLFGSASAGWVILAGHALAVILTGIAAGGVRRRREDRAASPAVYRAARPVGEMLSDAVRGAMSSIAMVGGFIVLFSVLTGLAAHFQLSDAVSRMLASPLRALRLPQELGSALLPGLVEMTAGCRQAALAGPSEPALWAASCAIVTWGGLSVQAQSMAFLSGTPLSFGRFSAMKGIQAALAFGLCLLLAEATGAEQTAACFPAGPPAVAAGVSSLFLAIGAASLLVSLSLVQRALDGRPRSR